MVDVTEKIIVVGAGINGMSTVLALIDRGYQDIHLFDKRDYNSQKYSYFDGCDSPSSDFNKFFRTAYGNELHYQKMAMASRSVVEGWNKKIREENWEGGEPVLLETGNVYFTDHNDLDDFQKNTLETMGADKIIRFDDPHAREKAIAAGLDPCVADPFECKRRGVHLQGIIDTESGTILADKVCRWMLHLCKIRGKSQVTFHLGKKVGQVDHLLEEYNSQTGGKKCVGIKTKDGKLHFSHLTIVSCGPWLTEVVPESQEKVEATAGSVVLIKITDPKALDKYDQRKFPIWAWKMKDRGIGAVYGFPVRNGWMKIGYRGLKWTNPQPGINSKILTRWSEPTTETNIPVFALKMIKMCIKKFIPEISKIDLTRMCWYGDSEDNDYLIDYSPYHEDDSLFVIGGDSGHSFKMLGIMGGIVVDIINKKGDKFLTNLFSWTRDREKKNLINQGLDDPRALQNQRMATPKDWNIYGDSKL